VSEEKESGGASLAERPVELSEIRAQMRESDRASRRLIGQAAHIEKLARRARPGSSERVNLNAKAHELRTAARLLLAEVSELSRQALAS
jgi:hypothetical protein